GYLNRPDLTAEKFVRNPFTPPARGGGRGGAESRLYKTGDLVRYLPNGNIEFLGRIDHQVKLRGFRIELGEIEAVLRQQADVQEAVALARDDVPGGQGLVAYVMPLDGAELETGDLRGFLREKLPEYMIPSFFVTMEQFPLTPAGKVDRRALPAPDGTGLAEHEYVAPRTPVEETLVDICTELLGVERVGVYDSFFALGGHSLLATQFISRLREVFHVELPLRALFEAPTVAELAERVEVTQETEKGDLEKITQMLDKIGQLSEDQVRAMLEEKKALVGGEGRQ
ncbi:MAG: phosphopantetheine-binding protein, partial [Chloroflexota bacterium]|nr:phosphopantetheine-binding protein [Chloroflexota bacterium]